MEDFKNLLKQKNIKATSQRALILKSIQEEGHVSIDKLSQKVRKLSPNISINTIYLNLEQLAEDGIISKVPLDGQKNVYEIKKQPHLHLVCKACGSIEDKDLEGEILNGMTRNAAENKFDPSFVSINIYGVCSKCALTRINQSQHKERQ